MIVTNPYRKHRLIYHGNTHSVSSPFEATTATSKSFPVRMTDGNNDVMICPHVKVVTKGVRINPSSIKGDIYMTIFFIHQYRKLFKI